jgi:hypothetical protein
MVPENKHMAATVAAARGWDALTIAENTEDLSPAGN